MCKEINFVLLVLLLMIGFLLGCNDDDDDDSADDDDVTDDDDNIDDDDSDDDDSDDDAIDDDDNIDDDDSDDDDTDDDDYWPEIEYEGFVFGPRMVRFTNEAITEMSLPTDCGFIVHLAQAAPGVFWTMCGDALTISIYQWNEAMWEKITPEFIDSLRDIALFDESTALALTGTSIEKWDGETWESIPLYKNVENCSMLRCRNEQDCFIGGQSCLYRYTNGILMSEEPPDKEQLTFSEMSWFDDGSVIIAADIRGDGDEVDRFLVYKDGDWTVIDDQINGPNGLTYQMQVIEGGRVVVLVRDYSSLEMEWYQFDGQQWQRLDSWPVMSNMAFLPSGYGFGLDFENELFWIHDAQTDTWMSREADISGTGSRWTSVVGAP